VDPSMMKRTAEMMKNNPMMREAAQQMMKNMSPEQMLEASKQAQQQMQGMSKEDLEKAWDPKRKD
jgi:glutamyl-tRNA reductase